MHFSFITALPLSTLLPLVFTQQSPGANGCQVYEPNFAFQIYADQPDRVDDLSFNLNRKAANISAKEMYLSSSETHSAKFRRAAEVPFLFTVSQGPGNTDARDLVVAFTGLPCYGPGPFSFEFNFDPSYIYQTAGQGQINMFRVDSSVFNGPDPTWNNIGPATGSLIGTFELPLDGPRLLYLNQLVCQDVIVLRFGITRYSSQEVLVSYINANGFGLRERNGC